MLIEWLPLDAITPYARNPREITDRAVAEVLDSLCAYGWRQPLVVCQSTNEIEVGHVRYSAAQRARLAGRRALPLPAP